jgi:hypothetical protein
MAGGITVDRKVFFDQIGYTPHKQQWLYHNSTARFRLPNCGRRFGKSTMAGRDLEPKLFLPDKLFWIVGPTYDLGEKEFRVIWDDLIVKMGLGKNTKIKRAYNKKQGHMFIQFPWNTRVEVRSADHPENLVGDALDWVIMSEAAKHKVDTWERFIRPALADKRGGADFPTTPEGYNWLYQLWMYGQDASMPDYDSWRFPSWANDVVYPGGADDPEIVLLKRTMTPEGFEQEIAADFGSFSGKIYPEWDVQKHVGNYKFNPNWPNYMAVDWGYTNPAAFVEFQVSPRDEVFIWREHYKAYTTLPDHVRQMKERDQPEGYHLDMAFADAADPESVENLSRLMVPTVAMPEAKENWRQGTDLVRSFMQDHETGYTDEYGTPQYETHFHVDFSCVNVINEYNNYRASSPVKGKNVPEVGQKALDHTLDAIRYGLVHKFLLGATYHLTDVAMTNYSGNTTYEPSTGLASLLTPSDTGFFTAAAGGEF